jgi:hypothetical protein
MGSWGSPLHQFGVGNRRCINMGRMNRLLLRGREYATSAL